jgi:hypothetical protein
VSVRPAAAVGARGDSHTPPRRQTPTPPPSPTQPAAVQGRREAGFAAQRGHPSTHALPAAHHPSHSPAAVKVKAGRAPHFDKAQHVGIEGRGLGHVPHAQRDVVQGAQGQGTGSAGRRPRRGRASRGLAAQRRGRRRGDSQCRARPAAARVRRTRLGVPGGQSRHDTHTGCCKVLRACAKGESGQRTAALPPFLFPATRAPNISVRRNEPPIHTTHTQTCF